LHERLGVVQRFTDWFPYRISQYSFAENVDYWVLLNSPQNSSGGRPAKDYALTIDMAKELCMVENNDQGRKIRKYFIECEKKYKACLVAAQARLADEDKRMLARGLETLAASGLYPPARAALFTAEMVSVLSGKPMAEYLPPVVGERDKWLMPTQLAKLHGTNARRVGMILMKHNLHGSQDVGHKHSEPFWNITPNSPRQVVSYKYDPEVANPIIIRELQMSGLTLVS
jgi:phage anti-repressor protein